MNIFVWIIFIVAAVMEVGGDALVRRGLRAHKFMFILAGCVTHAAYGLPVNAVKWDFSRLLGVYVGFFALVSVLFGRLVFRETIPASTWCCLLVVLAGCMVIQFGPR